MRNRFVKTAIACLVGLILSGLVAGLVPAPARAAGEHFLFETISRRGPLPVGTIRTMSAVVEGFDNNANRIVKLDALPDGGLVWLHKDAPYFSGIGQDGERYIGTVNLPEKPAGVGPISSLHVDKQGKKLWGVNNDATAVFSTRASATPLRGSNPTQSVIFDDPVPDSYSIVADNDHAWLATKESLELVFTSSETYKFPGCNPTPGSMVIGPDGHLWFCESARNRIVRISIGAGHRCDFDKFAVAGNPTRLAFDRGGNVWFTDLANSRIGKLNPTSRVVEFVGNAQQSPTRPQPGGAAQANGAIQQPSGPAAATTAPPTPLPASNRPYGIAMGPDGNMWVTQGGNNAITRIDPSGTVTGQWPVTVGTQPTDIVAGPNGKMYFTCGQGRFIGAITAVAATPVPSAQAARFDEFVSPDHARYFAELDRERAKTAASHRARQEQKRMRAEAALKSQLVNRAQQLHEQEDDDAGSNDDSDRSGAKTPDDDDPTLSATKAPPQPRVEIAVDESLAAGGASSTHSPPIAPPAESIPKHRRQTTAQLANAVSPAVVEPAPSRWRQCINFGHIRNRHYCESLDPTLSKFTQELSNDARLDNLIGAIMDDESNQLVGTAKGNFLVYHESTSRVGTFWNGRQPVPTNRLLIVLSPDRQHVISTYPVGEFY